MGCSLILLGIIEGKLVGIELVFTRGLGWWHVFQYCVVHCVVSLCCALEDMESRGLGAV